MSRPEPMSSLVARVLVQLAPGEWLLRGVAPGSDLYVRWTEGAHVAVFVDHRWLQGRRAHDAAQAARAAVEAAAASERVSS